MLHFPRPKRAQAFAYVYFEDRPSRRNGRGGKISGNVDPPPARKDHVARDDVQISLRAAKSFDHIGCTNGEPARQFFDATLIHILLARATLVLVRPPRLLCHALKLLFHCIFRSTIDEAHCKH
jgi:hypothetical protein